MLQLYEHKGNNYFSSDFFEEKKCVECGTLFQMTEKYNLTGIWGDGETCSNECKDIKYNKIREERNLNSDNFFECDPVIYKITQISTGKVYIGQTIRSYTLRWWEHIKSKEWICADPTYISYQILETLKRKTPEEEIKDRESYWINHYDSIKNGFNKVISKKEDA